MPASHWIENAATSITSPISNVLGKKVYIKVLSLTDLPGAMDKMGWQVAPKLMRRWLNAPAWEMPGNVKIDEIDARRLAPSQVDIGTVTMDWALGYPQVKEAYDLLLATWNTPKAIRRLKEKLQEAGWQGGPFRLGDLSQTTPAVDATSQINFMPFGSKLDTIDDMKGTLAKAQLKLAVSGRVARNWLEQDCFLIEELGIYVYDTYEFIDDGDAWYSQPLGIWSEDRCLSKVEMAKWIAMGWPTNVIAYPGFVPVFNRDFNRYRTKRGLGGDFVVYSDIKRIKLSKPVKIKL